MGRNQGKRRPFGEGVSKKGQKKLKLRNEAMAKAREILGNVEDGERPEEEENKAAQVSSLFLTENAVSMLNHKTTYNSLYNSYNLLNNS